MSAPSAVRGGTAPLASLTSIFTPPCPTTWLLTTTRLLSQLPAFPTRGPSSCDPPSWKSNIAGGGFQYYSPAICPQGFAVGRNCGLTKTRTPEGFPTVKPGETVAYCVPIGLACTTDTTDWRGGVWGYATRAGAAAVTVGPAIQIRWAEADLTMLETHPLTPGLKLARTAVVAQSAATGIIQPFTSVIPTDQPDGDVLITDTKTSRPVTTNNVVYETGGASTAGNSNSGGGGGGIGSLNRGTSIIVIVVVSFVVAIALMTAAFILTRRYKRKRAQQQTSGVAALEAGRRSRDPREHDGKSTRRSSRTTVLKLDPRDGHSELDATSPALGSTPNPAELEGDLIPPSPAKLWPVHQRSWLKSPSLYHPLQSPRSLQSSRSTRRTIRESFGEKINDPATALGRLKIPAARSIMSRSSPSSASPRAGSFWRVPRSPRTPNSPSTANRLSQQPPKPPPKSGLSGRPWPSASGRETDVIQEVSEDLPSKTR